MWDQCGPRLRTSCPSNVLPRPTCLEVVVRAEEFGLQTCRGCYRSAFEKGHRGRVARCVLRATLSAEWGYTHSIGTNKLLYSLIRPSAERRV